MTIYFSSQNSSQIISYYISPFQAFEKHYKEMQHTFLADQAAASADAEGRPLQEALRAMRAGVPGQQQQQTSASATSSNQGKYSMLS